MKFMLECLCIQMLLDAMQHILLTNEGESAVEVGSCQMLLHMHRGPPKPVLTHQALVAREQKK